MATQNEFSVLGATRIPVGLSAIVKCQPTPYQFWTEMRILSGGGTLEIVPVPVALSGSSAAGWGVGYPMGISQIIDVRGPATFYLAATGATMVMSAWIAQTSGASFL